MWLLSACTPLPVQLPTKPDVDPCFGQGTCIATPEGSSVHNGWATVALDDQGRAFVLYAEATGAMVSGLYLARNDAPGAHFGEPTAIPVPVEPNVGSTEKPSLAISGDQIAVAFTGPGIQRHGDARALWIVRGTLRAEGVDWQTPQMLDWLTGIDLVVEHARVAFSPQSELWAMWKRQRYGDLDISYWARESEGFVPVIASSVLSTAHDCSPPDFQISPTGRVLLALRSNVDGWLDTFVVTRPSEGSLQVPPTLTQVSDDAWRYQVEVCPEDGPRIVELSDGTLFSSWLSPNDFSWGLQSAWSHDGGTIWTVPVSDHGEVALGERWVSLAADDEGGLITAVEGLDGQTRALLRDAPGAPYRERWLTSGDGWPLSEVEIASDAGRTVALGAGGDDTLWLIEIDEESP